jgi:hypothetical protein
MFNLAVSYGSFGRHQDALALLEQALDLRRRVLPENDPRIGKCFLVQVFLNIHLAFC